jgi:DNA-directed RNA polymerase subunit RPC12/RpoP
MSQPIKKGRCGPSLGEAQTQMQHMPANNNRPGDAAQAAIAQCSTCGRNFQRDADWKTLCVRCWRNERDQRYDARPTAEDIVERLRSELEAIWPGLCDLANGFTPDNTTRLRAGTAQRRIAQLLEAFEHAR